MPRAQARPCRRVRDGVTIKVYKIINIFFCAQNSLRAGPSLVSEQGAAPAARGGAATRHPASRVPRARCASAWTRARGRAPRPSPQGRLPAPLFIKKRPTLYSPHAAPVTPLIAYMLHTPLHVELSKLFSRLLGTAYTLGFVVDPGQRLACLVYPAPRRAPMYARSPSGLLRCERLPPTHAGALCDLRAIPGQRASRRRARSAALRVARLAAALLLLRGGGELHLA